MTSVMSRARWCFLHRRRGVRLTLCLCMFFSLLVALPATESISQDGGWHKAWQELEGPHGSRLRVTVHGQTVLFLEGEETPTLWLGMASYQYKDQHARALRSAGAWGKLLGDVLDPEHGTAVRVTGAMGDLAVEQIFRSDGDNGFDVEWNSVGLASGTTRLLSLGGIVYHVGMPFEAVDQAGRRVRGILGPDVEPVPDLRILKLRTPGGKRVVLTWTRGSGHLKPKAHPKFAANLTLYALPRCPEGRALSLASTFRFAIRLEILEPAEERIDPHAE